MNIVFLNSWRRASHEGSGTAVGIDTLARALGGAGHTVRTLRPLSGSGRLPIRWLFNRRVPRILRRLDPDTLVVGFDIDGFRWGESARRWSPYVVCLKGVASDEARFSTGRIERRTLEALGRMERRNALAADRVLVPSAYSAEVVERVYGVAHHRLRVVPEGIDIALWNDLRERAGPRKSRQGGGGEGEPSADSSDSRSREPLVLSVARQYPRKDTATLLRAWPAVRSAVPGARLRVIGGGPELPNLRELARSLGIAEQVELAGALEKDETVREAYLAADIFCLPSRQEGFGIVFLEAMAAGLPIVAARAAAVPELVTDGEVGDLVPPGDPLRLTEALVSLLRDPDRRERMARAGMARARLYDLGPMASSFMAAVS